MITNHQPCPTPEIFARVDNDLAIIETRLEQAAAAAIAAGALTKDQGALLDVAITHSRSIIKAVSKVTVVFGGDPQP